MRIFNADGSEVMMCGNASRCIGKYVYDNKLTQKKAITQETLSGIKVLKLHTENELVEEVTVDMDLPLLANSKTNKYPGRQNVGKNNHSRWKRIQKNICLYVKSIFSGFHR